MIKTFICQLFISFQQMAIDLLLWHHIVFSRPDNSDLRGAFV